MSNSLFIIELREFQVQDSTALNYEFVCICSTLSSALSFCRSYNPISEAPRWWFAILETTVDPLIPEIATQLVLYVSHEGNVVDQELGAPPTAEK